MTFLPGASRGLACRREKDRENSALTSIRRDNKCVRFAPQPLHSAWIKTSFYSGGFFVLLTLDP